MFLVLDSQWFDNDCFNPSEVYWVESISSLFSGQTIVIESIMEILCSVGGGASNSIYCKSPFKWIASVLSLFWSKYSHSFLRMYASFSCSFYYSSLQFTWSISTFFKLHELFIEGILLKLEFRLAYLSLARFTGLLVLILGMLVSLWRVFIVDVLFWHLLCTFYLDETGLWFTYLSFREWSTVLGSPGPLNLK